MHVQPGVCFTLDGAMSGLATCTFPSVGHAWKSQFFACFWLNSRKRFDFSVSEFKICSGTVSRQHHEATMWGPKGDVSLPSDRVTSLGDYAKDALMMALPTDQKGKGEIKGGSSPTERFLWCGPRENAYLMIKLKQETLSANYLHLLHSDFLSDRIYNKTQYIKH